jgi:hypothetical protein
VTEKMVAQSFTSERSEQNARQHRRARKFPSLAKIPSSPVTIDTTASRQAGSATLHKRQPSQQHQSGYANVTNGATNRSAPPPLRRILHSGRLCDSCDKRAHWTVRCSALSGSFLATSASGGLIFRIRWPGSVQ